MVRRALAGIWRELIPILAFGLVSLFVLFLMGCEPECLSPVPNNYAACDRTAEAMEAADTVLEANGFAHVTQWASVIWIDAKSFKFGDVHVRGLAKLSFSNQGPRCEIVVATGQQPLISATALAHEMLHCSFVVSLQAVDGDADHSEPEWDWLVGAMNKHLFEIGL